MPTLTTWNRIAMEELLAEFSAHLSSPSVYTNPTEKMKTRSNNCLKQFFELYKKFSREELLALEQLPGCKRVDTGPLSELYTEGLDSDQIWEQIELVNKPVIRSLSGVVSDISARLESGEFQLWAHTSSKEGGNVRHEVGSKTSVGEQECGEDGGDEVGSEREESDYHGSSDDESGCGVEESGHGKLKRGTGKKSVVDDDFFNLEEMHKFLEAAEKEEVKGDVCVSVSWI